MASLILAGLRVSAWLYSIQSASMRRFWGKALGLALRVMGLRARIVEQNLMIAFPGDPGARKRLFRLAYEHLGNLVLEILLLFGPMRRYVMREGELRGLEHWKEAKTRGKGVIFLASHVGNWEIMSAVGALHGGIDLMLVTKHLKPEWLHRAVEEGRARCGVSATYEPRTMKDVLRQLKRNGTVGIVLDQYAGPPIGVRVPVFGVPVGTSPAMAALAKRTGAAVLPVVNYRLPNGRWVVEIRPPAGWIGTAAPACEGGPFREEAPSPADAALELARNTAAYSARLERDILDHPEQWLWTHRRFKGDLGPLREGEWREGRARS